ncbi:UDP-3-O-(3-hydroxymyristoyl)glucosamine N-acyltransferase [Paenibacillus gansuensis]|uniref:UDP-3-O-(3-hydroxymyristoyl)glucosamine N-acyltransferase n=1 Tax=Paenibacillus gansuensis TaxID=306542 RepID=A0ABW5PBX8_9BACL
MNIKLKLSDVLLFLESKGILCRLTSGPRQAGTVLSGFSSIYDTKPGTLTWMTAQDLDWSTVQAAAVICSHKAVVPEGTGIPFIAVEHPKHAFALVMQEYVPKTAAAGISPTAVIGEHCTIGKNVHIGHYTVLGDRVAIGDNTRIESHVTIHDRVSVGSGCTIHSGVVIGTDGFGYETGTDGTAFKIPHVGGVRIQDGVEIGSNSCIARGVLSDTVIGNHTKIGNLTHISHNVSIGEHTMITHLAHIGGSLTVGNHCWIGPGSVYKQGLTVGDHSLTGLGAVVIRDVLPSDVVAGVPAKPLKKTKADE